MTAVGTAGFCTGGAGTRAGNGGNGVLYYGTYYAGGGRGYGQTAGATEGLGGGSTPNRGGGGTTGGGGGPAGSGVCIVRYAL
jgi:hypothetical protein